MRIKTFENCSNTTLNILENPLIPTLKKFYNYITPHRSVNFEKTSTAGQFWVAYSIHTIGFKKSKQC